MAQEGTKASDRLHDLHAPCQQSVASGGPTDEDLPVLRPAEALNVDLAGSVELKDGQPAKDEEAWGDWRQPGTSGCLVAARG